MRNLSTGELIGNAFNEAFSPKITFATAFNKSRVSKAMAALDTLIVHYDLDNMSERELRTLHGQLGDIQTRLDEYANDVLYAAEECEPERIECECCKSNNTRVDYDFLDDEMVWCFACNDYTHLAHMDCDSETSDQMAAVGTHFLGK